MSFLTTTFRKMSRLQHKKGRKSNYSLSLNSDYWKVVRRIIIARDRECKMCGSKLYLEVHHLKYYVNGESIRGKELNHLDCLVLLCANCHKNIHKKT